MSRVYVLLYSNLALLYTIVQREQREQRLKRYGQDLLYSESKKETYTVNRSSSEVYLYLHVYEEKSLCVGPTYTCNILVSTVYGMYNVVRFTDAYFPAGRTYYSYCSTREQCKVCTGELGYRSCESVRYTTRRVHRKSPTLPLQYLWRQSRVVTASCKPANSSGNHFPQKNVQLREQNL